MTDAKAVVERFIRDGWDPSTERWRLDVIAECFDVDRYVSHTWGAGLAETGRRMGAFFQAFGPPREPLSDALVAEGDLVVHRSSYRIQHVGPVLGVEPTGRTVEIHHVEMWRIEDGRIVEHWGGIGEAWHLYRQLTSTPGT